MPGHGSRSGTWALQPSGIKAFIPAPLPPNPPLALDEELIGLISRADRQLGRLDGSILTLPDPNLFVLMYVRKEAVLSSQIEGTQSSLDDVLAAEAHILNPEGPRDVGEVINYIEAMNYGLRRLKEVPVSVRLIREIHQKLLQGVRGGDRRPGELRRTQNWIGPAGSTPATAAFIPPPPDLVPEALAQLERFLHQESALPPLLRIGLAHAQFQTIHPFLDGNGRVGRLLIAFSLCEQDLLQKPVLYLSHYLKRHRQEYYDRLQAVRDEGRWENWLRFFLKAVAEVAEEAASTGRKIVELRERHRTLVMNDFGRATANGLRVLEKLFSRPVTSVNEISEATRTSFTASNGLVKRFVKAGILAEITGGHRHRRYRYGDYVRLFQD